MSEAIKDQLDSIQVYVDGSYDKDTDLTGAGVVILCNGEVYRHAFLVPTEEDHSWNINGECHAVLEALKILSGELFAGKFRTGIRNITVNYDYLGIEKWAIREWKAKSKIARLYVKEFNEMVTKYKFNITFNKVKSHSGNRYNDMADELAYNVTH